MKRTLILFVMSLVLVSCKSEKKSEVEKTVDNLSNTIKAASMLDEAKEEVADLSKLTPVTKEAFKDWLPEEIGGLKRSGFKAGQTSMVNISSIEGTYKNEDETKVITINVIDRAGDMAAASTMGITMMFSMNFDEETGDYYKRSVTKGGGKAVEEYHKVQNRTEIDMLKNNDRFYVKMIAKGMNPDEAWKAFNTINFKSLN